MQNSCRFSPRCVYYARGRLSVWLLPRCQVLIRSVSLAEETGKRQALYLRRGCWRSGGEIDWPRSPTEMQGEMRGDAVALFLPLIICPFYVITLISLRWPTASIWLLSLISILQITKLLKHVRHLSIMTLSYLLIHSLLPIIFEVSHWNCTTLIATVLCVDDSTTTSLISRLVFFRQFDWRI